MGKNKKNSQKKNLPSGNYSKIFDPIFVKNKKGSWEFALNKYPTSINQVETKNNILEFYQYFALDKGNYFLDISLISDKKTVWNKSFEDEANKNYDYKLFQISMEDIDTSDLRVKIQVSQDGNISSKSFPIEFKNDYLMLSSIKNIDSALNQMNYILKTEERKELRELKAQKKKSFLKRYGQREILM